MIASLRQKTSYAAPPLVANSNMVNLSTPLNLKQPDTTWWRIDDLNVWRSYHVKQPWSDISTTEIETKTTTQTSLVRGRWTYLWYGPVLLCQRSQSFWKKVSPIASAMQSVDEIRRDKKISSVRVTTTYSARTPSSQCACPTADWGQVKQCGLSVLPRTNTPTSAGPRTVTTESSVRHKFKLIER